MSKEPVIVSALCQVIGFAFALCLVMTIMTPVVIYACWLWKCLIAIYPKL